ncbi:MAG: hypothetical protein ABEH60_03735 [Halonotius sp.]
MPLTLLQRFRRRFGSGDDDSDDSRFVPSPLDLSVRYAHGSGDSEAGREIRRIQEQAEQFDDRHR